MSKRAQRAFEQWYKTEMACKHYPGCSWYGSPVPLDVCPCDCYQKRIFIAGYRLARGDCGAEKE